MSGTPARPRPPGWRGRLLAYLAAAERETHAYGRMDCVLFPAGAVAAMTGDDPGAAFRGRYATQVQGLRLLRAAGHADPEAMAAALWPEVPLSEPQVGDLAVLDLEEGVPAVLGVVVGSRVALFAQEGLAWLPLVREEEAHARPATRRLVRP